MINYKPIGRLMLICFLLTSTMLKAADFYVNATSGDNTNNGTTAALAVKTIEHALTLASANDVIIIEGGDYSADSLGVNKTLSFKINGTAKVGILRMIKSSILLTLTGNPSGQLDISGKLYLDSGNISAKNSGTAAKLRLLDGAKQINGSKHSFIVGGYSFQFVANTSTNFTWHVGSAQDYRPVYLAGMTRSGIGAEDYYAQFNPTSGLSVNTTLDANTRNISTLNHWFLSKTSNSITTTNIQLRMYYDTSVNDDHVYDGSKLQILRSVSSGAWAVVNSGGSDDRAGSISTGVLGSGELGHFVLGNRKGTSTQLGGANALGSTDPFVRFEVISTSRCETDSIKLVSTSVNTSGVSYEWYFGDESLPFIYRGNTIPNNTVYNPIHVYKAADDYTITMIMTNSAGKADTGNMLFRINVTPNIDGFNNINVYRYPVDATDTFDDASICEGQRLWIMDSYDILNEYSNPNDDIVDRSIYTIKGVGPPEPSDTFDLPEGFRDTMKTIISTPGNYIVEIIRITDKKCVGTQTQQLVIYANPDPIVEGGDFCENASKTLRVTNNTDDPSSVNKVVQWSWEYDGQTAGPEKVNKSHTFINAHPGLNQVTLEVITELGCKASKTENLEIYPNPIIEDIGLDNFCHEETLDADIGNTRVPFGGSLDFVVWDFDKADPSNPLDSNNFTTYDYPGPDQYTINLRAISMDECVSTFDTVIRIHPKPTPDYQVKEVCFGDSTALRRVIQPYPRQDSMNYFWYLNYGFIKQDTGFNYMLPTPGVYDMTLVATSLAGCEDSIQGIIRSYYVPNPYIMIDTNVAGNDTIQCLNGNNFTFEYDFGIDGMDTVNNTRLRFLDTVVESPAISTSYSFATADTFTIQLYVDNVNGCADSVETTVVVLPSPTAAFEYKGVCMPDSVHFFDTLSTSTYPIVNRYWDLGDGNVDTGSFDFKHPYPDAGPYDVQMIVESSLGCTDTAILTLDSLVDFPKPNWALIAGSMPICKSDSVTFGITGGDSCIWISDGDTSRTKSFRKTGVYIFEVSNQGKCFAQDSVQVFAYTTDDIETNPDTSIYRGRRVNLYVKRAATKIRWSPSEYLQGDSTGVTVLTRQLIDSMRFYVTALDSNGCEDMDSVTILIIDPPLIKIPNIITPNGDDENETWNLIDIPDLFLYNIVITDRQGRRVYEAKDYQNDWNAVDQNGNALPNGVYFYYMKNSKTQKVYRGYIQVIR